MSVGRITTHFLTVIALGAAGTVAASDIYVSPNGDDQNSGTSAAAPLRTIAAASSRAGAGDTVNLMPGQYSEPIVPKASGTAGKAITYRSTVQGAAVISNVSIGILVSSQSYLVFDGIAVNGGSQAPNASVRTFAAIQNSNNIVIRNAVFKHANDWAGVDISTSYSADGKYYGYVAKTSILNGSCAYITIEDSVLDDVGDYHRAYGDVIQVGAGTQHILIQRNTITHGGHDLVEFDSDYGVLQNNTFNNGFADLAGSDTGYRSIEVQGSFNVVQGNLLAHARQGGQARVPPLASVRGNNSIVRQNVFTDGIAQGEVTWCGAVQTPVTNQRIYNNTMYRLGSAALSMWAYTGCTMAGNLVFANNLIVDSRIAPGVLNWAQHGGTIPDADLFFAVSGGNGLVDVGRGPTANSVVKGNLFAPSNGGPAYVITGSDGRITLAAAAAKYPQLFYGNIEARPAFTQAHPKAFADFQLMPNSAGVAAGVFPTVAVGGGTSNRLTVQDSLYFTDGNGVIPGDTIQLQGGTQSATIVGIDRPSNTLILSSALPFKDGQGVSLRYMGAAPDIGASAAAVVRPVPPGGFTIHR
jgi:hypothetical protein